MKPIATKLVISVALLALAGCGGPGAAPVTPMAAEEPVAAPESPAALSQPAEPERPVIGEPWIWFAIMAVAVSVGVGVLVATDEAETVFRISSGPELVP